MNMNREIALAPFSLVFGLLLMTLPFAHLYATDSDTEGELMLTNFTSDSPDLGWYAQNDNVMGGRSEGGFETEQGKLIFAGNRSVHNSTRPANSQQQSCQFTKPIQRQ